MYDLEGPRCRRIATVRGEGFELCREHAILMSGPVESGSGLHGFIAAIDREISRTAARDPLVAAAVNMIGNLFRPSSAPSPGHAPPGSASPWSQPHRAGPRPPPPPPPSSPPPDPTAQARIVLGFEPTERLTREMVSDRKKALARVFHPDMAGGSEAHMKRINQAADVLLAKLP